MELYQMTPKEVDLRYYGILLKQIEQKRNIRDIVYGIHVHNVDKKDRLDMFQLMPIMGDPSPKEVERKRKREEIARARKMINAARKAGYIK
jgi:hypothetical protein